MYYDDWKSNWDSSTQKNVWHYTTLSKTNIFNKLYLLYCILQLFKEELPKIVHIHVHTKAIEAVWLQTCIWVLPQLNFCLVTSVTYSVIYALKTIFKKK
jgi:hypothetical protein